MEALGHRLENYIQPHGESKTDGITHEEFQKCDIQSYLRLNANCDDLVMRRDLGNSPEAVETVVGAVDCEHRGAGVRFCNPSVPFQDYHFGPNLVVDLVPFVQNFLDVVLQINRTKPLVKW